MSDLELLVNHYERFITPPWPRNVAGPQRVLFVVYDPRDERRLRGRLGEFELATKRAKRKWVHCDVTNAFPEWMAGQKYREAYFENPKNMSIALGAFEEFVYERVKAVLTDPGADADTIVAVSGVASLYGFMRVSRLVEQVDDYVRGRLLLFFPGQHDNATYRLLDARDGWNYHAIPITAHS